MHLTDKTCVACEGGMPPLSHETITEYQKQLHAAWQVEDQKKIRRIFIFKNFLQAMAFVNRVAEIAEAEGHHPDVAISWNTVTLELWTHAIGGLSENDFIVAAKIDALQ